MKRVLVFHELGLSSPAVSVVDEKLREALTSTPYQIELYHEYFETILFPDSTMQQEFRNWYIRKYRDRQPDIIVAFGPSPLKFLVESHEEFFTDVPIVFGSAAEEEVDNPKLDTQFTGVWERFEPEKTLEGALRLQPGTQHVVVVGGMSPFDRRLEALFKERLHNYETKLDFKYLTDLDMTSLLGQLKHLPPHTVVLYTHLELDAKGAQFIGLSQAGPLISASSNAPVFSPSGSDFGGGEVGGYLEDLPAQAGLVGGIAARVLNGEKPRDISTVAGANAYTFDWRALQRWGLKESRLPTGSIVLNRPAGFWVAYRQYVLSGILLLLAQTTIIVALVWQWRKKKKAQNALIIANERLRLAMETAKAVSWDVDLKRGHTTWFGGLQHMFGVSSSTLSTLSTKSGDFSDYVHPEDRQRMSAVLQHSKERREPFAAEFRLVGSDGGARWVSAGGKFDYRSDGDATRMLGMAVDVTERKLADDALSTVSRRLIEAHEEERAWLAREFHDDVNQRLALLAVTMDVVKRDLPRDAAEVRRSIGEVKEKVRELGNDVQALSHRLHSSKLDYLGLVSAAGTFCGEFAQRQEVQVDFQSEAVPKILPKEISLCLFRVLQEALQNASKRSGSRQFQVSLTCTPDSIQLIVRDSGMGFDVEEAMKGHGLGIASMRERLKLVAGEFSIDSQVQKGTEVRARIPLNPFAKSASAG